MNEVIKNDQNYIKIVLGQYTIVFNLLSLNRLTIYSNLFN